MSITEKSAVISANNVIIAKNEQKVYHAGQIKTLADAESLNGKLQGTVVTANDVNNIEHNVPCRLESKNLFDTYECYAESHPHTVPSGILNGAFVLDKKSRWYGRIDIQTLPDTFTLSTYMVTNSYDNSCNLRIYYYDVDNNQLRMDTSNNANATNNRAVIVYDKSKAPEGTKYIGFNIRITDWGHTENTQIEIGTTATPYTPYITDFSQVEVSRYGKNLFEFKQGTVDNGSVVEELDNGAICQGRLYSNTQHNGWANGWYSLQKAAVNLKTGDTVTISCDYTVLELADGRNMSDFNSNNINKTVGIYLYHTSGGTNNLTGLAKNQPTVLGEPTRLYITYTVKADGEHYPIFTLNSNKVRVENIQIEYGTTATTYEPFKEPTTYQSTADGTVNGITSIAPNMTLLTNAEGVVINANYYKDPDIVISNLQQAVAMSGGE